MDYIQDFEKTEKSNYDDHINILDTVSKMYYYLRTRTNSGSTESFGESDLMQNTEKGIPGDTKTIENLDERKDYNVNSMNEPTSESSIAETQSWGYSKVKSTCSHSSFTQTASTCRKGKFTRTVGVVSATLSDPDVAEIDEIAVNDKPNNRQKGDLKPYNTEKDSLSEITDTDENESVPGTFHNEKDPILSPNFSSLSRNHTSVEDKKHNFNCSEVSVIKKPWVDNSVPLKIEPNNRYIKIMFGNNDSSDPPLNVEDLPMLITILIDKPIE